MPTCPAQWKYVSMKLNPTDYLTRGVTVDTQWGGPHFPHNEEKSLAKLCTV